MKKLNIGLIQQHNTADIADNIKRLTEGIRELAAKGAQLIVLQELHNSLYFCQEENVDMFNLAEPIPGPSTELFGKLAKELGVVIVTSLFERRAAGLYHNTTVVIESDGTIAGKYRKMHIPDDPAYYEKFYFTPGDLGFKPINTSVGRLGVLVCWDQWYPEAARLMALQGAEILIYPTAIGYADSDTDEEQQRQRRAWQLVQRGHAVANGLPVVAVNRVGNEELRRVDEHMRIMKNEELIMNNAKLMSEANNEESGVGNEELRRVDEHMRIMKNAKLMSTPELLESRINFWGTSFVAGAQGELLYEASGEDEERAIVTLDMERSEQVRRWWPFLRDRRIDEYKDITKRYID